MAWQIGDEATAPRYLNTMGWLHLECEDIEGGIDLSRRGAERVRWRHPVGVEMAAYADITHGDALMAQGRLDDAHELFERVYGVAGNPRPA